MNPVSPKRVAVRAVDLAEVVIAQGRDQLSRRLVRHGRGDVVDDAADRVRPEQDLARALEHLDVVEALDGRVIVGGVVAVRRVGERNAVLEQQDLARARRVQAADAEVRAQPEAFLVARKDAGTLRSASLTVKTRASSSTSELNTTAEPGIVSSLMRSPMTVTAGSTGARPPATAIPAFDYQQDGRDCERSRRGRGDRDGEHGASDMQRPLQAVRSGGRALCWVTVVYVNANHSYSY